MRELDELLCGWLEHQYPASPNEQKAAFQALLELSDPELVSYLLGKEKPAGKELASIVERIRSGACT
jgi:succinate dehydrogenase flavin-adding protein (antitoxin of CptAB toxin-antitoxin module)